MRPPRLDATAPGVQQPRHVQGLPRQPPRHQPLHPGPGSKQSQHGVPSDRRQQPQQLHKDCHGGRGRLVNYIFAKKNIVCVTCNVFFAFFIVDLFLFQ